MFHHHGKELMLLLFKADAKDVVENYRSISLLSIPSKCQERIVYNAVFLHVAINAVAVMRRAGINAENTNTECKSDVH